MLTKTDINIIKDLLKTFATKDDLKNFAAKDDLRKELEPIKKDLTDLKGSSKFLTDAVVNILEWTQDIHPNGRHQAVA